MPDTTPPLCEPRVYDTQEPGTVCRCGRSLLYRDPTKKEEACPGGVMICADCVDDAGGFFSRAYDARAARMEWEGG